LFISILYIFFFFDLTKGYIHYQLTDYDAENYLSKQSINLKEANLQQARGVYFQLCGRGRLAIGFTTTYAISAYHH
jgi:hypothetical protein